MDKQLMHVETTILSVDHTFKVATKMRDSNGQAIYGTLYTGCNEYEQGRFATLAHSTAQEELMPTYELFRTAVRVMGQRGVQATYTDNTLADSAFLEAEVPWAEGVVPIPEDQTFRSLPVYELVDGTQV